MDSETKALIVVRQPDLVAVGEINDIILVRCQISFMK